MANTTNQIEWCTVKLGEDLNWWVIEVSDDIHWDVDGLSIIDPRQFAHLIDLAEPLREYNFDQDIMDRAFIAFKIQKDLGDGHVRLVRTKESFFDTDELLFGLPDVVDEVNGPYADFLNHITRVRVNMLNDSISFQKEFTIDELEEELREEENNNFIEGRSVHMFNEVTNIMEYVPTGWELDGDDSEEVEEEEEEIEDFPEIDDEEAKKISESENLKWDEDDDEEETDDSYEGGPPDEKEEEKIKTE